MLPFLHRIFRPRPSSLCAARYRLRAWYLFSERSIDDANAGVAARLASHGVDLDRFDLTLITWEDFQRGVASLILPDSRSLPVEAVVAGLAVEYAERHLATRAAAREWLGRAEEYWYQRGVGLGGNPRE